jgi:small-conductance mechanosensitive channel
MKHKPFDSWILDNPPINKTEQQELKEHLKNCPQCNRLQTAWVESQNLIKLARVYSPKPGFSQHWKTMLLKRREIERTRQVRRTLFLLILLMGIASLFYMIKNNLLVTWVVSAISMFASLFIYLTKASAEIGELLSETPALLYGLGFVTLGIIAAIVAALAFTLWNFLKKGNQKHSYDAQE